MDAGGNTITIGGLLQLQKLATTDTDAQNMGVKVVTGNLS